MENDRGVVALLQVRLCDQYERRTFRQSGRKWINRFWGCVFLGTVFGNISVMMSQALPTKHWDLREGFTIYVHESWTTEQGLPQDVVTAIAQTRDGYLWIGTQSGMARFNGVTFKKIDRYNTPVMKSDFIRALTVADDSIMWIGTDQGGVLSLRDGIFASMAPSDSATAEGTRVIVAGHNHTIWAAIPGSGVWK